MNISDYKGVFVFIEQRENIIQTVSLELLGKATELAKELDTTVTAVVLGENVADLADDLVAYGADKVFVIEDTELKLYRTEPYADAFTDLLSAEKPEIVLFGATSIGRDLAPRISARLATGLTADCTSLEVEDGNLIMTRPAFGGNIMASIISPDHRPQLSTVRPGVMTKLEKDDSRKVEIVKLKPELKPNNCYVEVLSFTKEEKHRIDITEAEILVSAGRGVGSAENFKELEKLAEKLGAEVSASRSAVDSGWASADQQVGQTGKTVKPHLYLACGISGAIQHVSGMEDSELIIAINKDKDAPIFGVADLGIVGNLEQIVPLLLKKLEKSE